MKGIMLLGTPLLYGVLSFSLHPAQAVDYQLLPDDTSPKKEAALSLIDFQNLLFTEVNDELEGIYAKIYADDEDLGKDRFLQDDPLEESQMLWDQMLDHGWNLAEYFNVEKNIIVHRKLATRSSERDTKSVDEESHLPFVVCSRTPLLKTGAQRLPAVLQFTGAEENDTTIISNDDDQSCFYVSTTYSKAKFVDSAISNDEYVVVPLIDLMKVSSSTIKQVQSDEWSIPSAETRFRKELQNKEILDWERIVRVTFAEGRTQELSANDLLTKGGSIVSTIEAMGDTGSKARRRRMSSNSTLGNESISLSDAFSLTSTISVPVHSSRRVRALSKVNRMNFFSRALESGVESAHSCKSMFANLALRPVLEDNGIEIVLNPETNTTDAHELQTKDFESSASNPACIISLIVGLAVHPQVLNVEIDAPISPDDYQSQWISQSNIPNRRPLFDAGLTGKGQIISVTDSGLDINHKFFGPTSNSVFQNWNMAERKIVRYEYQGSGDQHEPYQGHGSRVAGVIAGKLASNNEHEADGIAPDAKIHMWDIQKDRGFYNAPGPNKLFNSIYKNGQGAKITNGSWSSGYRPYTARCRMYDSSLRDKFDEFLFVASAGNSGNDIPGKVLNTIHEPASCKNVMAVGASQSDGDRLYRGDLGRDYLADFSSRGPTMDGRMKPDIVGPGYTLLAPRAYAASKNKEDTYETFGTSFSAPVISGSAALIRQYFEEGWFPCGKKGCGKAIFPSGPLVKAVMMNGAQSLKRVQKVPRGPLTEQIRDYDNHQGMGLINMVKSLPLKNANKLNGVVVNNRALIDGKSDTITIKTKQCPESDLSVTISWYDPAGASNCAKCLVNDLDLSVQKGGQQFHPNGKNAPDRMNNNERIRLKVGGGEEVKFIVKAHNLATRQQKYSLIAVGCFDVIEAKEGILPC